MYEGSGIDKISFKRKINRISGLLVSRNYFKKYND